MHCLSWVRTDIAPAVSPSGYSPADLQTAYGLTASSLTGGANQTLAVVDAYDYPQAESDLATYRSTFALPACNFANGCFIRVNQTGQASNYPIQDPAHGWELEEALDLDMASAICPNCEIVLVEANTPAGSDFFQAEDTAATTCGATVISNSWDGNEYVGEVTDEVHFNHPGVQITFASGDNGCCNNGTTDGFPVSSRYVTAVGGTTLCIVGFVSGPCTGIRSEVVWPGSGSDCSQQIPQPAYQSSLAVVIAHPAVCTMRIANDVAAVADGINTPVAVYNTTVGSGCGGFCLVGGTSAATPIIAGVYAIAGNGATIGLGYAYAHTGSFNDITSGTNGSCSSSYICTALAGYDGPSGVGSPNGIGGF